jgi:hypothetical protein
MQTDGGDTWNVIPETVVLRGTTRSFSPAVRDQMQPPIDFRPAQYIRDLATVRSLPLCGKLPLSFERESSTTGHTSGICLRLIHIVTSEAESLGCHLPTFTIDRISETLL